MAEDLHDTIQSLLSKLVVEGKQGGVQVAVYIDGKLEVDAWAGVADVRTMRPVDGDTVFPVFSTTKGVFATVIHILAERGKINYDTPIAQYWPEFAAMGKETITVRHALAHTSGIPYAPEGVTAEQLRDWEFMCAAVARLTPVHTPGLKQIYHPITYGWIVGEIARRVDGREVAQILAEEICHPLGLTRMFCGIPAELEPETAFLERIPEPVVDLGPPPHTVPAIMEPLHAWINRPEARMTAQPGCSGIMNARSIARHYAALLPEGVDGVRLVSPERVRLATQEQVPTEGYDANSNRKALGYILGDGGSVSSFGHGGFGGSAGYANPVYRLAVGVTLNRFNDIDVAALVASEIRSALKITS